MLPRQVVHHARRHAVHSACTCASTSRRPFSSSSSSLAPQRGTHLPDPVLDLSLVLSDPAKVKENMQARNHPVKASVVDDLARLETEAREVRRELQSERERRNTIASWTVEERTAAVSRGVDLKSNVKALEPRLAALTRDILALALLLPNTSDPSSPVGDESHAVQLRTIGPPVPTPPPKPVRELDHHDLSSPTNLGWTDAPSASLISGTGWPLLTNEGAILELALINYAMSVAVTKGFQPVLTPDAVRSDVALRCGFQPRENRAQQTYFLGDGREDSTAMCLAGTAEIPLVGMSGDMVYRANQLPLRRVAVGRAFRAEAGARGLGTRGLYRVHQFSKVEMVVVCKPEESAKVLEELRDVQEEILGSFGLSLRVLDMPTQELGASAAKKYDIEAWMPGRGTWGELSSASNCTDFQSRRLSIRYRPSPAPSSTSSPPPKLQYTHTLNATAAAIPRIIIALLENGAVLDEKKKRVVKVRLPEVLRRFWIGGEEKVEWVKAGEALRKEVV
ncbi:serine-tRNA ligase [Pseudohyphozyma bogoriensis]|nr:serine-tRNA ligase [Pseudohyphozyma bogoriensis]